MYHQPERSRQLGQRSLSLGPSLTRDARGRVLAVTVLRGAPIVFSNSHGLAPAEGPKSAPALGPNLVREKISQPLASQALRLSSLERARRSIHLADLWGPLPFEKCAVHLSPLLVRSGDAHEGIQALYSPAV